ncbi:PDR/VanB family oxidoreductase [Streptomyces sp. NBC_00075]|uniref:PDR/VanB family oxidoreductase n=1 Tax=Streptomyces sp. NBC_00075 TaxID=2975641 RepID=UPI0032542931
MRERRILAEGVMALQLTSADGSPLPAWEPGAHIEVALPSGLIRHYSLCGDPADRHSHTVAVLRERDGRGGSHEVHELLHEGSVLQVSDPRNHFRLVDADRYLFIAGGIGITPILSMIRAVQGRGAAWQLVYGGRTRDSMAFLDEIGRLPQSAVEIFTDDETGYPDIDAVIKSAAPGTAVYACGPPGLLRTVEASCSDLPPSSSLHVERFSAGAPPQSAQATPATAIDVELRRTGTVLRVEPPQTILDAILDVAPGVAYSCQEGYCGSCEATVIEGVPLHRDTVLSEEEADSGRTMMICTSWSRTPRLVLDL